MSLSYTVESERDTKKKKKRRLERKNSNHSTSKWQNVSVESVLTCLEFKLPTKKHTRIRHVDLL